jgi:hypothetical protein
MRLAHDQTNIWLYLAVFVSTSNLTISLLVFNATHSIETSTYDQTNIYLYLVMFVFHQNACIMLILSQIGLI